MPLATSLKIGMFASESGGITITCKGLGFRVEHASQTPHQCLPWQAGSGTQARKGERDAGRLSCVDSLPESLRLRLRLPAPGRQAGEGGREGCR